MVLHYLPNTDHVWLKHYQKHLPFKYKAHILIILHFLLATNIKKTLYNNEVIM